MAERRSFLRTVGSISLATLASRVLGLVRDQVQSYYFGAGAVTDAFFAAFKIPNLLRDLFAEGALSSAFVPTFTAERERRGAEAGWRLVNRTFAALAVVLGAFTVLLLVGAPWIVAVYVPKFGPEKAALTVTMVRILSPFLLAVALAAAAMGVLNTCGRFFLPALAPAWFNVAAIAGTVLLVPVLPRLGLHAGLALAIGAMAGGALQFLVQVPAMRREGLRFAPEFVPSDPGLRRIATLMLPATFGLAATQINILVDMVLASGLGDGPISWLQYAFRLMQLPIGLFGVAIATANLAQVSRDAATGDAVGLARTLSGSLRAAAVLTLPATAGLIVLREPIVRLLFERGRFDASDTAQTAAAVMCYAFGLYAYSLVKIQVPTFYALGDTRTPVLASAASVGLKIAANLGLLWLLPRWGVSPFLALALATSLAAWTNWALLARGVRRHVGPLPGVGTAAARAAGVAIAVGGVAWLAYRGVAAVLPGAGTAGELLRVGISAGAGVGAWVLGLRVAGLPEGARLLDRLGRLARPRASG